MPIWPRQPWTAQTDVSAERHCNLQHVEDLFSNEPCGKWFGKATDCHMALRAVPCCAPYKLTGGRTVAADAAAAEAAVHAGRLTQHLTV